MKIIKLKININIKYSIIMIRVPDDESCETLKNIYVLIRSSVKKPTYVSHIELSRKYNIIYALVRKSIIDEIKKSLDEKNIILTEVPLSSAENIEFYKLAALHIIVNENGCRGKIDYHGKEKWVKNGKIHRDNDLPAIISANGTRIWYKDGEQHRDNDLPAVINPDGSQAWFKDGKRHRDNDLPAVIHADGSEEWWKNNKVHRDNDLPALIEADRTQSWYQNGKAHRDNDLPAVVKTNGLRFWYKNNKLHRDNNLPAIIYEDGTEEYWKDGNFISFYNYFRIDKDNIAYGVSVAILVLTVSFAFFKLGQEISIFFNQ